MDPQREAVYEWEGGYADWNRRTLTLPSVRSYVRTACAYYGVPHPTVVSHAGKALAVYDPNTWRISFPDWCCNPAVALHEAAHHVAWLLLPREIEDHGPEWLGIYLWLLEKATVAPGEALRESARVHKLRWLWMAPERLQKELAALRSRAKGKRR